MLTVKDKIVGVLGLGKSGQAAIRLLLKKGVREVYGVDCRRIKGLRPVRKVKFFFGPEEKFLGRIAGVDFLIKSPGVPPDNILLQFARKKGKEIFSELSLGLQFCRPAKIIAVTGTNGKTTTASLISHLLTRAGLPAVLAGNIGQPLTGLVEKISATTILVLEVSSYQLSDTTDFHPDIAVVLNITPDHLQHHRSFSEYVQAKKLITANQDQRDYLILNADDKIVREIRTQAKKYYFSVCRRPFNGIYWKENNFVLVKNGQVQARLPGDCLKLPGQHNQENAMAAILAVNLCKVHPGLISRHLRSFSGVEHRLQNIGSYRGVTYINDSKATNVASTIVALNSFPGKNIWLILGGLGKGSSYRPLRPLIRQKVKGILLIGQDSPRIENDLDGTATIYKCQTLKRAVSLAASQAEKGDIVLLSPACASFDQFRNFEERGQVFARLARQLGVR